jgi:hypothetical protein
VIALSPEADAHLARPTEHFEALNRLHAALWRNAMIQHQNDSSVESSLPDF